jgi:hypothetical protein
MPAEAWREMEPAMPTKSGKPLTVISYAYADEPEKPAEGEVKWLSFVTGYLRPAIKHGAVDLWIDRVTPGGGCARRACPADRRLPARAGRGEVVRPFAPRCGEKVDAPKARPDEGLR